MKSADLIRELEQAGWTLRQSVGSHHIFVHATRPGLITVPRPKPMSDWQADREYKGWTWGIVEVPVERFFGPAEKINITVPGRLLKQIDEHARAHGETRSGFLTKAALEAMRRA